MRPIRSARPGFTIIDTAVCIIAAGILLACTLAMTQDVRDRAQITKSMANLRNLATATMIYSAEWNDRQFTLVADDLARYGDTMQQALANYAEAKGKPHPSIILGERTDEDGERVQSVLDVSIAANHRWLQPISFDAAPDGGFRAINVSAFNQYLTGRFFEPIFYAPKDTAPMRAAIPGFEAKADEAPAPDGPVPWSSYSRSAAAMFSPTVLAAPRDADLPQNRGRDGGFKDPFSIDAGFRSPALSQTLFPDLKTMFIEHHWLQNRPIWATECNEKIEHGRYGGCEPHYFNSYAFSEPATAFVDGHIQLIRVADVLEADARVREQTGSGLWSRNPGGAADGYYESMALDPTRTSFHIFTTDGIRGRDIIR